MPGAKTYQAIGYATYHGGRFYGKKKRMELEHAIASLPPGARYAFVMHDIEGYKHEEIAQLTGTTSGSVKAQLHRARKLLRERLTR